MAGTPTHDVDILIIGSGPGGYVCAIRAAQLGARTAIVEKNAKEWGGTCLNWGCIPTKALIASVERLHAVKEAARFGVIAGDVTYDFAKIAERKDKIVSTLRGGVASLLKSNHVEQILGVAKIAAPNTVQVALEGGGSRTITATNIIVATGAEPVRVPIPGLEGEGVWTSNEAVSATRVPASMLIIGAGAVGLEFAYVYNGLGCKCTVVEVMDEIIPAADAEACAELRKALTRQGIAFHLSSKVTQVERKEGRIAVTVESPKGPQVVECEIVLMGAGRRPVTRDLGLEALGVKVEKSGIVVDDRMGTNVPGVYAIGDVTGKMQLAHVASHQGIVAAENACGHDARMDYRAVPAPVFTEPEFSSVGITEKQAREAGYDVVVGKFPFRPLGKAMAIMQQDGFVKIVSERKYGEILGVHIVGPHASDLIHEAVAAIQLESTVEDLARMIHGHPTLAEAVMEASMDVGGASIHKMRS